MPRTFYMVNQNLSNNVNRKTCIDFYLNLCYNNYVNTHIFAPTRRQCRRRNMDRIKKIVREMAGPDAEAVKKICEEIADKCIIIAKPKSKEALYKFLTGPASLVVWETLKKSPDKYLEFNVKYPSDEVAQPSYAPEVWEMVSRRQIEYQEVAEYIIATYQGSVYAYTK